MAQEKKPTRQKRREKTTYLVQVQEGDNRWVDVATVDVHAGTARATVREQVLRDHGLPKVGETVTVRVLDAVSAESERIRATQPPPLFEVVKSDPPAEG